MEMTMGKDKNYVSVWFWMFAMFVTVLPCIGFVMVLVWALVGENESRKNYFRAVIAWHVIFVVVFLILLLLGLWPEIQKEVRSWLQ